MNIQDFVNGSFEALGGLFVLNHCRILYGDKAVKGVSILSTVFFLSWGCWNIFFYPHLGLWWSFAGGVVLVMTNMLWSCLLVYYKWFHKSVDDQLTESLTCEITKKLIEKSQRV